MYRLILESLLGLTKKVDTLHFSPCLPAEWKEFTIHYRYYETVYHIRIIQTEAGTTGENTVQLVDDRQEHTVEIRIPAVPAVLVKK
jgi:cellobiose phosphorylase